MTPDRARATEDFLTFVSACTDARAAPGCLCLGEGRANDPRQHDPEETSLALLAFQLDPTAVHVHRPSRRGQAKPRPARFPRTALVDTVEALEDPPLMHRRNAQPCVLDLDRRLPGARLSHLYANRPPVGGVFDRVIDH